MAEQFESKLAAWFVRQIGLLYAVEKLLREKKAGPRMRAAMRNWHEVRLGANARINALAAWRVFQIAMSRPRLHATSTAKSISGAMHATECDIPLLPPCQRQRPVSPDRVPFAQLAVLINAPAR
jgi:hypothetical protein